MPGAGTLMSIVILTAVLSCLNSSFYICSRVLFVLAEKGDAPRWLVQTNRRKVPSRAVLLGSLVGFLGVGAAMVSPDRVFAFLVNASGAIMLFVYMAIAVAQIRLRRRGQAAGQGAPALPMWGFPYLSYFSIVSMVAVLLAMMMTPSMATQFWASVLSVVVILVAGFMRRRRSQT